MILRLYTAENLLIKRILRLDFYAKNISREMFRFYWVVKDINLRTSFQGHSNTRKNKILERVPVEETNSKRRRKEKKWVKFQIFIFFRFQNSERPGGSLCEFWLSEHMCTDILKWPWTFLTQSLRDRQKLILTFFETIFQSELNQDNAKLRIIYFY